MIATHVTVTDIEETADGFEVILVLDLDTGETLDLQLTVEQSPFDDVLFVAVENLDAV